MKVLLVDDNREYREILAESLATHGHIVLLAGDGAEALDILQEEDVDLVISDIQMPVITGTELCKRMRTDARLSKMPFLYISGYPDMRLEANACKEQNDRVLSKMTPFFEIIELANELVLCPAN